MKLYNFFVIVNVIVNYVKNWLNHYFYDNYDKENKRTEGDDYLKEQKEFGEKGFFKIVHGPEESKADGDTFESMLVVTIAIEI